MQEWMRQGEENEALWKQHLAKYLGTNVIQAGQHSRMDKTGVDLVCEGEGDFFPEVIQVKSYVTGTDRRPGNYGALSHLEKGLHRGCIVPLVVGAPELERRGNETHLSGDIEQALACDGIWISPLVYKEEGAAYVSKFVEGYKRAYAEHGIKYMNELGISKGDAA